MATKRLTTKQRAAQEAAWDAEREAKLAAHEALRAAWHDKAGTGTVLWFDKLSGEGMVRDCHGKQWTIYACNLPGHKTWFAETACVYLNAGDTVEFSYQIDFANYHIKIFTLGIPDPEKWACLDHKRLAFRCDEEGKLINGLFA